MKNYVIGIAGVKNSGKDTVASMINYIFAAGVSKAKYQDWVIKKESYDYQYKDRIIHFADPLKDVLSIIYNLPRNYFDNRKFKDECWYCFETNSFINDFTAFSVGYSVITIENILEAGSLKNRLDTYKGVRNAIKLRTLLQYFGTNVCRNELSDNIWIKSAMSKIIDKAESRRLCIVPDVRFVNEADALRISNDSLYGGVIRLTRNDSEDNNEHESEIIDFITDEVIENNGTKMALFYKVLNYVDFIINDK